MLFDRLAGVIAKRHRLVIVLWLVILLACVPLFSKVSSTSEQSLGSASGDSATAQTIINSSFGNSTSGGVLFVVVSAPNVTQPSVHGFVAGLAASALADAKLSNLTRVSTVYDAASTLLEGAARADGSVRSGVAAQASFFFGIPSAFGQAWGEASHGNYTLASVGAATNATAAGLGASAHDPAQLAAEVAYLRAYSGAVAQSFSTAPGLQWQERLNATVAPAAEGFISSALNSTERPFALAVVSGLDLYDYNSSAAVRQLVVSYVSDLTLYTTTFADKAYPLSTVPPANASALSEQLVADPAAFGVPSVYQSAITSFVSPDHRTMLVVMTFPKATEADVVELRSLISSLTPRLGIDPAVSVTGEVALSHDFSAASLGDLSIILPVTVVVLIAATGIFFRSVVTPGVSLLSIGVALGVADTAVVYLVETYFVGLDPNISSILLTVIIGVGTDYSVFILARYREERVRGADRFLAVTKSVTWAGESIATSGLTVIISFLFLGLFSGVPFLKGIGYAVGGGVLVALLGSLTLVPSIIMSAPNVVFWPNVGKRFERYAAGVERTIERKTGYFSRSAKFSIRHAKLVTALALLATVPAAYTWVTAPVGYDFLAAAPANLQSVAAFNNITQSFGAGTIYPTYAVMKFSSPLWNGRAYNLTELGKVEELSNITLATSNVQGVTGPTRPGGERVDYSNLGSDPRSVLLERSINAMISTNGTYALVKIDLKASPQSETSIDTAQQLRNEYKSLVSAGSPVEAVYLGGVAGSTLDSKNQVNSQFEQIIAYVMVGVAAVLLLVLGSLFLPLFAILTIVMSIAWTLAATGWVFQRFYNFPLLFITPLALFVLLLGLGMDYNIFILTRIREEASKGVPLNDAITAAIERTGGIITAAALILAGSLGALMISSNLLLKEFGFAFFYSVLIDAMIMRTYVVPSVMSLVGKWNFYAPGRLQRVRVADEKKP